MTQAKACSVRDSSLTAAWQDLKLFRPWGWVLLMDLLEFSLVIVPLSDNVLDNVEQDKVTSDEHNFKKF